MKKKTEKDFFEEYHKSAMRQDLFGYAFAIVAVVVVVLGFFWLLQHSPLHK